MRFVRFGILGTAPMEMDCGVPSVSTSDARSGLGIYADDTIICRGQNYIPPGSFTATHQSDKIRENGLFTHELCAKRLEFLQPLTGEPVVIESRQEVWGKKSM